MANPICEEIDEFIKSAEKNLKTAVKEAKNRRENHLIAVSNSSGSAITSCFGSSTMNSISSTGSSSTEGTPKSNDLSLSSSSVTQIEDIEMPSSFNSSTLGLEDMLSISGESPKNILVSRKDTHRKKSVKAIGEMAKDSLEILRIKHLQNLSKSSVAESPSGIPGRSISCNVSSLNTFFLNSETEKVLKALEAEELGLQSQFLSPPSSRLTILDLENLNDSLISGTLNSCDSGDALQHARDTPSMSTPKTAELDQIEQALKDYKMNLSFNGTFSSNNSPPPRKETTYVIDEEKVTSYRNKLVIEEEKVTNFRNKLVIEEEKVTNNRNKVGINTTFDKCLSINEDHEKDQNPDEGIRRLNITFEADGPKHEDNLNRTFEVVGNGSFIIEGQCTNLMDMESEALETVLGSATSTPISRGTRSYPDTKKLSKSALKKRLSMLTGHVQDGSIPGSEKTDTLSSIPEQKGSKERPLPLGSLTKEQVLSRLRKNNNPGSVGSSGPMKAVPLSAVGSIGAVKKIDQLKRRATSTPTGGYFNEMNSSEDKEKLPSLPSFESVSSIGTDGINSREVGSDDFMATPEVFRHRSVGGPRITSTPTLVSFCLKFAADLGLGSVPTPIVAPVKNEVEKVTEEGISSYVAEESKKVKNKLNFTTSNDSSPDSVFPKVDDCEKGQNLGLGPKVSKGQKCPSMVATTSQEKEPQHDGSKKVPSLMNENFQLESNLAEQLRNPNPENFTENLEGPDLEYIDKKLQNSDCKDIAEKLQNFEPDDHAVNFQDQHPDNLAVKVQDQDPDNLAVKLRDQDPDNLAVKLRDQDPDNLAIKLRDQDPDNLAIKLRDQDPDNLAIKLRDQDPDNLAVKLQEQDPDNFAVNVQEQDPDNLAVKLRDQDLDNHNDSPASTTKKDTDISKGVILLEKNLILQPNELEMEEPGNSTKVFASTAEVEVIFTELKDPLKDSNLSSIKDTDLTKELINTGNSIKKTCEDSAKVSVCCQCGSLKQASASGIPSEDNRTEYKADEVLGSTEDEEDILHNVTPKANEIIEAYEEMHRDELQNLAAEFNETVDLKSEEHIISSKNESIATTGAQSALTFNNKVKSKVNGSTNLRRTSLLSNEMAFKGTKDTGSGASTVGPPIQRSKLVMTKPVDTRNKLSLQQPLHKPLTTKSNTNSNERLNSEQPSKNTQKSSLGGSLKLTSQAPLKLTPRVSAQAPLKLTSRVSAQASLKLTPRVSAQASLKLTPRVSAQAPLKLTPRVSAEAPLKLTPRVSAEAPLKLTPRVSAEAPLKLTPRPSGTRESLVKPQSLYRSTRPILKPVNAGNMPSQRNGNSVIASANQTFRSENTSRPIPNPPPRSLPNIKTSLYSKTLPEIKTLPLKAPKFQTQTGTLPKPNASNRVQTDTAKPESLPSNHVPKPSSSVSTGKSTGNQSRLNYSSSNKENTTLKPNPVRKSVVGSGIRPPSVRSSIPVPRSFK